MSPQAPTNARRVPLDHHLSAKHVAAAFSGEELWFWDQPAQFKVVELDTVVITSGAVVLSDPMFGELSALQRRIPPGKYPVSLALVHLASGDERIAYARMLLSDAPVATWEPAWHEAIPQSGVPTEYAFYYTNTGTGCFMDAAVKPLLRQLDFDVCLASLKKGFNANYRNTWSWFSFKPHESRAENVVCHQSEKGGLPAYFGLDAQGNAAVLLTDFQMFSGSP
jgi:hypothetical protein